MSDRALALLRADVEASIALAAEKDHSAALYDRVCLLRRENLALREDLRAARAIVLRQEGVIRALVAKVPRVPRPPEGCSD